MKKFLALLLSLCMVMSLAPAAFAAGETTTVTDEAGLKAAVEAGGEIVLGDNIVLTDTLTIPADKTVTLDLNGKTISQTKACTESYSMIVNNGMLIIEDNTVEKAGKISFNDTNANGGSAWGSYTIQNNNTLTVNSGTVEHLGKTYDSGESYSGTGYAIQIYSGSCNTLTTINGGRISAFDSRSVRMFACSETYNNKLVITDGVFDGQVWLQHTTDGKNVKAELIISGGEFAPKGPDGSSVFINDKAGNNSNISAEISGGIFNTKIGATTGQTVSITGGKFTESAKTNTNGAMLADGVEFGDLVDGYYSLVPAEGSEAAIGNTGYPTLADAIDAAQPGDTVTLLKDVTISEKIVVTEDLIIDGNNKTLTYTGSGASARAIDVVKESNGADLTISNLTIDCTADYCQRGINYNTNGKLTLTNVTVKGDGITYAVNLPGSSNNCTVDISGGSYAGCIALNIWGANSKIDVTNASLTSVDKATHENYAAISLNNDGTTSAEGTVVTVTGGSITALDENGDASHAVRNSTDTATVSVSDTTAFNGISSVMVAIVDYGTTEFYSCLTLQDAIAQAVKDKENNISSTVKLLRDIELTETLIIPDGITVDKAGHEIKAAAGYTLTVSDDGKTYTVSVYVPPYIPPVVTPDPEPEVPEIEAPTVDTDAPVVDSTTTENEDGSTTKEETLENGTKVETTTNTDGSSTSTATKTDKVENEDGSATTTTTTVTTNTSATGETVKESTQEVKEEKADGSATTTTTTVTETEKKTEKVEVKEETVVKEDGTTETTTTATTETALSNGSSGTTTTDETGKVEAEVTVSKQAVQEAAEEEKPVELAMPAVEAAKTSDEAAAAATVTVTLPKGTESATVAIPVTEGSGAGTVAVIVNADGTETIVSDSKVTENGLEVEVPDGAVIKVVDNSTDFEDVDEDDWHKDAVDFTSSRNIMNGMGETEFSPDTTTTRAMVWTMLARYAGVDTTTGETWDEVGRQWAMENGISDGTMANEEVTREQLVTMIWRYLGEADSDHDLSHFEDHGDTSDWALVAKQWAVEMGIINGVGQADGTVTLDPKGDASRAQVAQIFFNFITKA